MLQFLLAHYRYAKISPPKQSEEAQIVNDPFFHSTMKKTPILTEAQKSQIVGDKASNIQLFAPGQVISLWDMLFFTMGELAPWRCLEREEEQIRRRANDSSGSMMSDSEITRFLNGVDGIEQFCDKFCLSSAKKQLRAVANHFKVNWSLLPRDGAWRLLETLLATMRDELNSKKLIFIQDANGRLRNKANFGAGVHFKFKNISYHAEAAGTCFAFEQWTASVFHSMLVVEIGIRYIAKRLHVKTVRGNRPIEHGTWGDIVTACKIKIASLSGHGKRAVDLKMKYNTIIDKCAHLSHLWRNPVFHGRRICNEQQADKALSNAITFMESVAAIKRH